MSTTTAPRPSLASFWHDLPREGRLLLSVVVFEFLGTGLVLPFHVVYLHEVRGFSLSDVGLLLGLSPLLGFLLVGPGGALIDRIGARRVVIATLALLIAGDLVLMMSSTVAMAAVGLGLSGLAFGVSWPASQSLVAAAVPSELRQRYFGVNFTLLNLGIGLGGLVGGAVLDVHRMVTFQAIYAADAVSFVPGLLLMLFPLRHVAGRPVPHEHGADAGVGYLALLRRPAVASLTALGFAASFVGYAQLNTGMPAFARAVGEVSTQGLGMAFAANTLVIVVLQLVVLQRIEGRRRTRVIAMMGLLWAVSWLLLGGAGLVPGTFGATMLVASCASVFALGETLLQPTIPALVNDLAPDHLRGRYNALSSAAFQLPAVVAPPVAGALIGHHLGSVYIGILVVGSVGVAVLAVARLERVLPPEVNGLRTPAATEPAAVPAVAVGPPPGHPVGADTLD